MENADVLKDSISPVKQDAKNAHKAAVHVKANKNVQPVKKDIPQMIQPARKMAQMS